MEGEPRPLRIGSGQQATQPGAVQALRSERTSQVKRTDTFRRKQATTCSKGYWNTWCTSTVTPMSCTRLQAPRRAPATPLGQRGVHFLSPFQTSLFLVICWSLPLAKNAPDSRKENRSRRQNLTSCQQTQGGRKTQQQQQQHHKMMNQSKEHKEAQKLIPRGAG